MFYKHLSIACSDFFDSALFVVKKCSFALSKLCILNFSRLDSEDSKQALSNKGFSVIQVLVSVAILGVVAMFTIGFFTSQSKLQKRISLKADRESIRQFVSNSIDCDKTAKKMIDDGESCDGTTVDIYAQANSGTDRKILDKDGTRIGDFTVRGYCDSSAGGIVFRAVRLKKTAAVTTTTASDFLFEPITNEQIRWGNDKSRLNPVGSSICPNLANTLSSAASEPKDLQYVMGSYDGDCTYATWTTCSSIKTINLGKKIVSLNIDAVSDGGYLMLLAFSGRKTIQMRDWQSQISIFGGVLPSGSAVDQYYSSIQFDGNSFKVRTSMNIAGTSLPTGYKQIYNYMAWVEK